MKTDLSIFECNAIEAITIRVDTEEELIKILTRVKCKTVTYTEKNYGREHTYYQVTFKQVR